MITVKFFSFFLLLTTSRAFLKLWREHEPGSQRELTQSTAVPGAATVRPAPCSVRSTASRSHLNHLYRSKKLELEIIYQLSYLEM